MTVRVRTLNRMAQNWARTLAKLANINGTGERKIMFGVRQMLANRHIPNRVAKARIFAVKTAVTMSASRKYSGYVE